MDINQKRVFEEAKRRLQSEPWYKGVCIDNLPDEDYCIENFEDAVSMLEFDTALWDDPSMI